MFFKGFCWGFRYDDLDRVNFGSCVYEDMLSRLFFVRELYSGRIKSYCFG